MSETFEQMIAAEAFEAPTVPLEELMKAHAERDEAIKFIKDSVNLIADGYEQSMAMGSSLPLDLVLVAVGNEVNKRYGCWCGECETGEGHEAPEGGQE